MPRGMRNAMASVSERAGDAAVEAVHDARAPIGHEPHDTRLSRLEARRRAGRDIEAAAARLRAVEAQRRVRLEEMIVRAHLDRPVAGIGDLDLDGRAAGVQLDLAGRGEDLAGDHGCLPRWGPCGRCSL